MGDVDGPMKVKLFQQVYRVSCSATRSYQLWFGN